MNDLGTLAQEIICYNFPDDKSRYPLTFVSGWLNANVGKLNALTNELFCVDGSGNFQPSLEETEESIFTTLFEIYYYDRAARDALRGFVYSTGAADNWTLLREGDTTIQRENKNAVSRTFREFRVDAEGRLDKQLAQYNIMKAAPYQVAGEDADYS